MNRPWQIWLAFALCAGLALAAMAGLTREAVRADLARTEASKQAELEQHVSLVLWRMDTKLAPLIAEEVARPPAFFRSYESVNPFGEADQRDLNQELSALTAPLPAHVLLNFTCPLSGACSSPQVPDEALTDLALSAGCAPEVLNANKDRLRQLSAQVSVDELLKHLPEQTVATVQSPSSSISEETFYAANAAAQEQTAAAPVQGKGLDLQQRGQRYQDVAQQEFRKQRAEPSNAPDNSGRISGLQVTEGISRPVWVGDNLLLARRVVRDGVTVIQGSWLDWPGLREELLAEAKELLPDASLSPVRDPAKEDPTRMLAGLPVVLNPGVKLIGLEFSEPMRWALGIGWGALLLALASSAVLLAGVVALSERRAAFVSSVTHELRTPLTTFRMYSDMLARGMVPDAQRRQQYLETLRGEAERLTHLVENVLSYARLERGRAINRQESISVDELVERLRGRLSERAAQAGSQFVVSVADGLGQCKLQTDVGVVEQILFNLVDNAAKYAGGADDRRIHFEVQRAADHVTFTIRDHGPGFAKAQSVRRSRAFSKTAEEAAVTAPGVGLGLALCRRLAKQLGGQLEIASHRGEGATITLQLPAEIAMPR